MKTKVTINAVHENEPVTVEIEVEFEPGEYIEVIKEIPSIIKQIKKTIKG